MRSCNCFSLSLAAITGQPIRINHIRANREKPGLAIQHLTGVWVAAALCQANVRGDSVGSTQLEFIHNQSVQAGFYSFDVAQTLGTGPKYSTRDRYTLTRVNSF
ncbi:MAG: RNA 3'-terminal phosphate cyclase [Leptolyngbya sp. IPPAS B-1204]